MTSNRNPQYLSRGIDYLGNLGAKLRDLQGFKTLAHELIQNADDVLNVTEMTFDVCDYALIVDNDGVFSDCGNVEQPECRWKNEKDHLCDFHRFRLVGAGDKRAEEGTTGAFGIGFIAVYQITDQPELISNGRHWILHEEKSEDKRIEVCTGCEKCNDPQLPGTRFIFPWAKDANSELRKKLRANAVTESDIETLIDELVQSLPPAMLFLKRLKRIELKRNGKSLRVFERARDGDTLLLTSGNPDEDQIWYIFQGDFEEDAERLKAEHQGRIESKRLSEVNIAIPQENTCKGLFCAFLPTEQETGLPLHINADFFPSNDRKRLNLTSGYEAEWNRTAIGAAAKTLAQNLNRLPKLLGHQSLWALLKSVKDVSIEAEKGIKESELASFWKEISSNLKDIPVVYTTIHEWVTASQCRLLQQKEEADNVALLEKLEIKIVSEDLRPYQTLLREIGVSVLGIRDICEALSSAGLNRPLIKKGEWMGIWGDQDHLRMLWKEIDLLRHQEKRTPNTPSEHDRSLMSMSIAPIVGGELCQCSEAFCADTKTKKLFSKICPNISFLSDDPAFEPLYDLCPRFNAASAIDALSNLSSEEIASAWQEGALDIRELFEWFEKRRNEILKDTRVKTRFKELSIFPGAGELHKLDGLYLPGDFKDPLGLADIVDLDAIGVGRDFLKDIGMRELNFKNYVLRLPKALSKPNLSDEKRRQAISLLAERLGRIRDDKDARDALIETPLVEYADGKFRNPKECYFKSDSVDACLGSSYFCAVLPPGKNTSAIQSLYKWLGVADEPRIADLIRRAREISNNSYSKEFVEVISKIVEHLGKRFKNTRIPEELEELKDIAWLPARGKKDRWYQADELYAVFQEYLFESQALFLDVPRKVQNESSNFLEFLGIGISPETKLVVGHLLYCAENNLPAHNEIYRFLNDNVDDPVVCKELKNKRCLYIDKKYRTPKQVFWEKHPFGRYRQRLGKELFNYRNLLDKLGVREEPNYEDAIAVLKEIADDFGSQNKKIDEETREVVMECWRLLDDAIDQDDFDKGAVESLKNLKCIPNCDDILYRPDWIFFENRAGLAKKFGEFISKNVIVKPMKGGRAMSMAGVRLLADAVEVEVIECNDAVPDNKISARIRERRDLFARILDPDSQNISKKIPKILERLDSIHFESAQSLTIKYRLNAFNQIIESKPEATPALFKADINSLIFTRVNGQVRWPAFSRELAIAILSDQNPGKISAQIKEIVSAENLDQANQTLDEYGFPKLDTTTASTPSGPSNEAATTLGTDSDVDKSIGSSVPIKGEISKDLENIGHASSDKHFSPTAKPAKKTTRNVSAQLTGSESAIIEATTESKTDYKEELQKSFNRPGKTELQEQVIDTGKVKDPDRRREKIYEGHKDRIYNEVRPEERRKKTIRTILEGPGEEVREYLSQFYGGKCQICGKTFPERDGKPFFIANYIVPRERAWFVDTPANALCLCADHFAKWQHGAIEADDIIEQIENFKTEKEGGNSEAVLRIKICGEECEIRYNEKHLLDLQELLRASDSKDKRNAF